MPEPDPFNRWLSEFTRQVDATLRDTQQPSQATPEVRQARQAFDIWWKAEQQPVTSRSSDINETPNLSRGDAPRKPVLPEEWPLQVERLAEDRAKLQQQLDLLQGENRGLRERISKVQSEIADFETRLSRSRQGYEEHIQQLNAQVKQLEDQVSSLRDDKAFLEKSVSRTGEDLKSNQNQIALERQRAEQAEKQVLDLRQRQLAKDNEVAALRENLANQIGALEELRRQASVYSQRLVQAKETTDVDVMSLRQELKMFLEEMRVMRNTIRKGE